MKLCNDLKEMFDKVYSNDEIEFELTVMKAMELQNGEACESRLWLEEYYDDRKGKAVLGVA